ncbi:unnamed protein product [Rhizopus stolonifer]
MSISPAPNAQLLIKLPLRVKSRNFQCKDCLAQFDRMEHLLRHSRKHTGIKPYSCQNENCPKQFSRFDNMLQHMKTHLDRSSTNNLVISKKPLLLIESKESVELRESQPKSPSPIVSSPTTPVTTHSRLSIKDLCNPVDEEVVMPGRSHISQTEFEAVNILVLMSRDGSK